MFETGDEGRILGLDETNRQRLVVPFIVVWTYLVCGDLCKVEWGG